VREVAVAPELALLPLRLLILRGIRPAHILLPAITLLLLLVAIAVRVRLLAAIALLVALQVAILLRPLVALLALLMAALATMAGSVLLCTHEASSI